MIGLERGFLFIHIPKTGGNSIASALAPWADDEKVVNRQWQDGIDRFELANPRLGTTKHSPYWAYADHLTAEQLEELVIITCIRDPWSRMQSLYLSPHRGVERFDPDDFASFVDEQVSMLAYLLPRAADTPARSTDLPIDVFLRFTHLRSNFAAVTERLGIEADLPHVNRRVVEPPPLSAALVAHIAGRFAAEIDLFGSSRQAADHRTDAPGADETR